MRLSQLTGEACPTDPEITGLAVDSRKVEAGYLFAALSGSETDGVKYIPQAENNGAAAILARAGVDTKLPLISDPEPRRRLSVLSSAFYPRQPGVMMAITGTNGKTSTAIFTEQLLHGLGFNAGSLGTLGAQGKGYRRPLQHTTPEPITLHETLNEMAQSGLTHVAMEVSSHALSQYRADGVQFAGAAFTNITQDHLDFHENFDAYFQAKARLFSELIPGGAGVVVNADGAGSERLLDHLSSRNLDIKTVGRAGSYISVLAATPVAEGIKLEFEAAQIKYQMTLPLIGAFQAENALVALALVTIAGAELEQAVPLLKDLSGVPGRMQLAATCRQATVYVDYAHTPDAIASALSAARPHSRGRVIAIIGAGGDRDASKRLLMGRAAAEFADEVIVTDDNPRGEDPAQIRQMVVTGCPSADEIGDRTEAIFEAVARTKPGDIVLIMGKGHEQGQIVGSKTLPFDDVSVARQAAESVLGERSL